MCLRTCDQPQLDVTHEYTQALQLSCVTETEVGFSRASEGLESNDYRYVRNCRHACVMMCIFLNTEVSVDSIAHRSPGSCLDLAQCEASRVRAATSQSKSCRDCGRRSIVAATAS